MTQLMKEEAYFNPCRERGIDLNTQDETLEDSVV